MIYEESSVESLNIEGLKAYNGFWNLLYKTTDLTEQKKDELVSTIMEQYPTMSLIVAEMYLAEFITKYIENRSKQ